MRISDWSSDVCSSDLLQDLVVQMRSGRKTGRSDIADDLALGHPIALLQPLGEAAHMGVGGGNGPGMAEADIVAIALVPADAVDHAVAGGVDRRAGGGGEVDAAMHAAVPQDRKSVG